MSDVLLLLVLFTAVGIGWWLGRRSMRSQLDDPAKSLPSQYYRGLNFLLDGSRDSAIDAFTQALAVNSETFDTHIALGNALRVRGEVERAIRIHQNLLARPSLPHAQLHLAHLELSRDYISAGLFDRAERLLLDLVEEPGGHKRVAMRHLLEIYEAQRDWRAAVEIGVALLPKRRLLGGTKVVADEVGQPIGTLLAHYHCELAGVALETGDLSSARGHLRQSLAHDSSNARASIMLGELELIAGNPKAAVEALRAVYQQAPDFLPDTVDLLRQAYMNLGQRGKLKAYLQSCLEQRSSTTLMLAIAEEILQAEGEEAAKLFLRDNLRRKPSLRGVAMLMTLHSAKEAGEDETLQIDVLHRLVEARASYQCSHCGFRGRQLHWYCPGCKHWGTIKEMGVSGEFAKA